MDDKQANLAFDVRLARNMPIVMRMGVMPYDPHWAKHMHVPAENEVLHILEGRLTLVTDNGATAVGPGDTLLIPAGLPHRDSFALPEQPTIFFCFFKWSLAKHYFQRIDNTRIQAMPGEAKTELAQAFEQLRAMLFRASETDMKKMFDGWFAPALGPRESDHHVANSRLLTILMLILRHAEINSALPARVKTMPRRLYRTQELIAKAKRFIAANYARPISLRETAGRLGTSTFHLSHAFSQGSEFTFVEYLREERLQKARQLLKETSSRIADVAHAVGYPNANYFAKVFRARFGKTPSMFASAEHPVPTAEAEDGLQGKVKA